jgi:CRISPR/Cas system endoribonuclease Cas6 (RAMP superfamily)
MVLGIGLCSYANVAYRIVFGLAHSEVTRAEPSTARTFVYVVIYEVYGRDFTINRCFIEGTTPLMETMH